MYRYKRLFEAIHLVKRELVTVHKSDILFI
jgi:hypothetical protein